MADVKLVQVVVVTPERAVLDETVASVVLPMFDGELGVLPGRAPLTGRLGPGELRLPGDGPGRRYFVDGGFVQVSPSPAGHTVVTVLTPKAISGRVTPGHRGGRRRDRGDRNAGRDSDRTGREVPGAGASPWPGPGGGKEFVTRVSRASSRSGGRGRARSPGDSP